MKNGPGDERFYHQNVFAAFENGCELDLRVRLALEFIKSPAATLVELASDVEPVLTPAGVAKFFLDLAQAVMEQSVERGWVHDLPETAELSAPMRKHIERNVRAQVHQQVCGQRIAQEDQARVMPVVGGAVPPRAN